MRPYYDHDGITIYHGDCRGVPVPSLLLVADAVVSDPPYGMDANTDSRRFSGGQTKRGKGRGGWAVVHGDTEPFDPRPWLAFGRVVLWGSNHFAARLPVGTTLVWVKKTEKALGTFLSDAEVAWMKGGHGVYVFRKSFPPPSRIAETGECLHPMQKPEALMGWCIEKAAAPVNGTILDPYMGSGTTLAAAKARGYRAIGIEIEERYCEIAAKRLSQGTLPLASGITQQSSQTTQSALNLAESPRKP